MTDTALKCPAQNCRGTREDLRVVYTMEGHHKIESEAPGEVVVDAGYNVEPPGGAKASLLCLSCGSRSPLPTGITVTMMIEGKKKRIFGPDGRSR